jgi:hypothetical protein
MDQNLINAGTDNFNLPHDVVQLPSGGVFYKNKKKSIKVGYLTANDENILINATQNSNQNIILSLLRNKVYEHDLRPEELLESDIEAILIFLRNTSFGPDYRVTVTDPKTGKPFETTILLDELNIKRTESNPDEQGLFTTQLPRTGSTVKLRPLNYSDITELEKLASQYPAGRVAPTITWRLNKIIQEVDGIVDREKIAAFVEALPIMDSKYIRSFIKNNVPSLDLQKTVLTPSGDQVIVDITFGVEFFRPFF